VRQDGTKGISAVAIIIAINLCNQQLEATVCASAFNIQRCKNEIDIAARQCDITASQCDRAYVAAAT